MQVVAETIFEVWKEKKRQKKMNKRQRQMKQKL